MFYNTTIHQEIFNFSKVLQQYSYQYSGLLITNLHLLRFHYFFTSMLWIAWFYKLILESTSFTWCVCECACVCVWERARDRDRERSTHTEEHRCLYIYIFWFWYTFVCRGQMALLSISFKVLFHILFVKECLIGLEFL